METGVSGVAFKGVVSFQKLSTSVGMSFVVDVLMFFSADFSLAGIFISQIDIDIIIQITKKLIGNSLLIKNSFCPFVDSKVGSLFNDDLGVWFCISMISSNSSFPQLQYSGFSLYSA